MIKITTLATIAMLTLTGCSQTNVQAELPSELRPEKKQVKIGVIAPLTGGLSHLGEWLKNGVELSYEQKNTNLKIDLLFQDTKCLTKDTNEALTTLIDLNEVDAFIGPVCGGSIKVAAIKSNDKKIVGITPSSNFGKMNEYFFSTQRFLSDEPEFLAKFVYNELNMRRAAIMYHENEFGVTHDEVFTSTFESLGGKIVAHETIASAGQVDFRAELTKIKAKKPDMIYLAYSNIGELVNQIKELGIESQIITHYGAETPDLLDIARERADGIIYSYRGDRNGQLTEKQKSFHDSYLKKFSETPSSIAAEAYDAFSILIKSFEHCPNKNPDCIAKKMSETNNFDGVSGVFSIDKNTHNIDKPIVVKEVKDGEFVFYDSK